jgi:UDP-N-acetylmuramoyl-tripeptide--D-alanyl-D-alanine ligase
MRYQWNDLPRLVRTPIGRLQLCSSLWYLAWPFLARGAALYRRTLVRNTRVVVVIGSFGKSTTTHAVTAALNRTVHPRFAYNAFFSVARAALRIRPHDRHSVIEVGIGAPGQMVTYARMLRPDIVVVTSIGSEHNRSLPTLEVTREEKSRMVQALPATGLAVLNGDDPHVLWMKSRTCARIVTFGLDRTNDVYASDIVLDWPTGTRFLLHAGGETRVVRIRLMGKRMVYPMLAAVAVALAEGFTLDRIIPALEAVPPTPGRMEPIRMATGAFLLSEHYKSSWETIEAALDVLAEIPASRRIVVLGDIEEPPGSKGPMYRALGERVGRIVSRAIFTGDSGNWRHFSRGAKRGGLQQDNVIYVGKDLAQAANLIRKDLTMGDVVLVKGRAAQRLDRVSLRLAGRTVRCDIAFCNVGVRCAACPMLERGWKGVEGIPCHS